MVSSVRTSVLGLPLSFGPAAEATEQPHVHSIAGEPATSMSSLHTLGRHQTQGAMGVPLLTRGAEEGDRGLHWWELGRARRPGGNGIKRLDPDMVLSRALDSSGGQS